MKARPTLGYGLALLVCSNVGCGGGEPSATTPWEREIDRAEEMLDARRYEDAEEVLARALDGMLGLEKTGLRWRALHGWARARLTLGFHEDAKDSLDEMRSLASGDPRREAETARFAAAVLHREGNLVEAEEQAMLALEMARRTDDWKIETNARSMLATVYSLSGRHDEALRIDEELVERVRGVAPRSRELALELNELGIDYRHFGRFEDAIAVFEESLDLYRAHEDIEGQAMVLYNLASVCSSMGDVERALELKLQSLQHAEAVGHTYGLGLLNEDIGATYLEAGNIARARGYLEEALEINRSANQVYGEMNTLESIARLELEAGRPERSREHLTLALTVAEEKGYRGHSATLRTALSRTAVAEGNAAAALDLADEALVEAVAVSDPEVEFRALEAKARALGALGRTEEAVGADLEAIALLESWRGRMALGDLRMGVARPRWDVFESAVRGLFALERFGEAFEISERAKARLLLELMAERRGASAHDDGGARLRAELRERYSSLQGVAPDGRPALERRIDELTRELEALQSRAREARPVAAASRYPTPVSLDALDERLVGADRGLLVYLWGERDVYGWWLHGNETRGRRLGAASDLQPLVEFLRLSLENSETRADWRPAARRAYRAFVAPIVDLDVRELSIVADGPLTLVPFEAFLPELNARPLGVTHRMSYGPSASVLSALARAEPPARERPDLLALAYSPPNPTRIEPGAAVVRSGDLLTPIPEAVTEAAFVVDLFRTHGAELLVGEAATLESWRAASPENFRYLHFAAHARTSDRAPDKGYLLLADGQLTAAEIRNLEIDAELVTLSGCETGLGHRIRGEGVVGLAHAFLAAGARSTVVSLWRVQDRQAAELMRDFYGALRSGRRPAEALVAARKVALARGGEFGHPSVWASFVLVGGL